MRFFAIDDLDIRPVVDIRIHFVGIMALVDVDFKSFFSLGHLGVRHQPKRVIGALRRSIAVAAFEVAILKMLFGPNIARSPVIATARFFAIHELERPALDLPIVAPTTAENRGAG